MKLFVHYVGNAWQRTAYITVHLFLNERIGDRWYETWQGAETISLRGIWKLFIDGKQIRGDPESFEVDMDKREVKVFRLLIQAKWEGKRKIWERLLNGEITKEEMLKELEEKLPAVVLGEKLKGTSEL